MNTMVKDFLALGTLVIFTMLVSFVGDWALITVS